MPEPSLSWSAEHRVARAAGRALRVEQSVAAGLAIGDARMLLDELAPLERHEYHRSDSARLSERRRQQLWTLRGRLAGRDEATCAELVGRHIQEVTTYWRWLLTTSAPTDSRRNLLRGDLAEAIERDGSGMQLSLAAWTGHAEIVRVPCALVADLAAQIRGQASSPELHERSFAVALTLAVLSGMPDKLVELHSAARRHELKVVSATLQQADDRKLLAGSMAEFHEKECSAVVGSGPRGERQAPELTTGPDGKQWLTLAPAELSQLGQDIKARSLVEAIEALRVGEAPRNNIVFKKARGVWLERIAQRRDEAGDPQSSRLLPIQDMDRRQTCASAPELAPFDEARTAVQLELESVYQEMCFDVASGHAETIFPTDIYGARLSREFSDDHVRAAFNCLRALTATAAWRGGVQLPLARHGQREVAQHMARSAPAMWGGDGNGRQTRRGFAAAVAFLGQNAISRCDIDDLPEQSRSLVSALGEFCAVAVIDGLVAMLFRFRLTAVARRATAPPTDKWRHQVDVTIAHLESTMAGLLSRRSTALTAAAPLLAEDLDQLVEALDELSANLADEQVGSLAHRVRRLTVNARALTETT